MIKYPDNDVDDSILLLRIQHMLLSRTQRNQVETDLKTSSLPAFIELQGALQTAGEEKSTPVSPSGKPCMPQSRPARPMCSCYMKVMGVASHFLIGFEA